MLIVDQGQLPVTWLTWTLSNVFLHAYILIVFFGLLTFKSCLFILILVPLFLPLDIWRDNIE